MTGPVAPPPDVAGPDWAGPPPGATGPGWAELLEATVTALRDVRSMILELHARAATLSETLDELVARVVDEQAAAIRAERDPIDPELLEELHP